MLCIHPSKRLNAADAMQLAYYSNQYRPKDQLQVASKPVDWSFDKFEPTKRLLQNHIYVECAQFHPHILQRDAALLRSSGIDKLLPERPLPAVRAAKGGC